MCLWIVRFATRMSSFSSSPRIRSGQPRASNLATGHLELLWQESVLADEDFRRAELVEDKTQDGPR